MKWARSGCPVRASPLDIGIEPEDTERACRAYLKDTGEGPFLRTGDLGFVTAGELFVTGRLKDLIIISGRKLYPQDIELTVEQSHPALRPACCVAFSIVGTGERKFDRRGRSRSPLPTGGRQRDARARPESCRWMSRPWFAPFAER